jgi:hypothetical protein
MFSLRDLYNSTVQLTTTVIFSYVVWVVVHFTASNLYMMHCVGKGFIGLLLSPLFVSTSYCQGLSWIIFTGSRQIMALWVTIGTYLLTLLCTGKKGLQ